MSKDYTNASMSTLFLVALKFSQVITLLVPVEVQPRSQGPLSFFLPSLPWEEDRTLGTRLHGRL